VARPDTALDFRLSGQRVAGIALVVWRVMLGEIDRRIAELPLYR
jgi:hypothetical protein